MSPQQKERGEHKGWAAWSKGGGGHEGSKTGTLKRRRIAAASAPYDHDLHGLAGTERSALTRERSSIAATSSTSAADAEEPPEGGIAAEERGGERLASVRRGAERADHQSDTRFDTYETAASKGQRGRGHSKVTRGVQSREAKIERARRTVDDQSDHQLSRRMKVCID